MIKHSKSAIYARWLWIVLTLFAHVANGADNTSSINREIDQTLWQPFQCAFEAMDGKALNALYARKVLRVTPDGIDTEGRFRAFNASRFEQTKRDGGRVALEFWLDSQTTNAKTAYAVGFFRSGVIDRDGKRNNYYGQFHIVLRKQRSGWKIVQDWDTDTIGGRKIGPEDFARGRAREVNCR